MFELMYIIRIFRERVIMFPEEHNSEAAYFDRSSNFLISIYRKVKFIEILFRLNLRIKRLKYR